MSTRLHNWFGRRRGGASAVVASLCLFAAPVLAQETPHAQVLDSHATLDPAPTYTPLPLALESRGPRIGPNRETTPTSLRLRLTDTLSVQMLGAGVRPGPVDGLVLAASSLNYQLDERLMLSAGAAMRQGSEFTPVASIHCENGTLASGSYRASNCFLVDDAQFISAGTVSLGAQYELGERLDSSVSLFRSESTQTLPFRPGFDAGASALLDPLGSDELGRRSLRAGLTPMMGAGQVDASMTGIDLEFQLGVSTDQAGDLVFGLQLTRVLDNEVEGMYYTLPGIQQWTIAEPFDTARLSIDWAKGSFSGGISSYYRSPVDFMNQGSLDAYANFDVHFTWRAPWNASLSVGASNMLGGGDEAAVDTAPMADPFESIYGRIPYVRYKQDL